MIAIALYGSLVTVWTLAAALAEQPVQADVSPLDAPADLEVLDQEVTSLTQRLGDWSEQSRLVDGVLHNLWEKNGWNSESDQFARRTASRISQIPPWKFRDRMDALSNSVRDRYGFDDAQSRRFQQILYQETWKMTLKYGPTMMKSAKEALDTRLQGQPFRPEQVARWFSEVEPLMDGWQQDILQIADQIGGLMTPEQREVFGRDMESLHKRMDYFVQSSEAWRNGQWKPEDWGLQSDPLHRAAYPMVAPGRAATVDAAALAHDESTWVRFVREFIRTYELNDAQQQACDAVLQDLVTRAQRYRAVNQDQIQSLTPGQRFVHPLLQPIRTMFLELKSRLAALPTEDQRLRASLP